jgi:TatD DNase family protein
VIDTHCHLDRLDPPTDAAGEGLDALITVATGPDRLAVTLAAVDADPRVFAVVGVHPNEAAVAADPQARAAIEEALRHPRVVGVGETGVDLYWDKVPLDVQLDAFRWQGGLARAHDLPLVLHVRDAEGARWGAGDAASTATAAVIAELAHRRGVLHCTNGHPDLIATALDLGWFVSFAGNLTYRSAEAIREAATAVPLDRLLVETDAPYLAPVPHRGRPNRPAHVRHTAAELARLRGLDPDALEATLDANARRAFGLPDARGA